MAQSWRIYAAHISGHCLGIPLVSTNRLQCLRYFRTLGYSGRQKFYLFNHIRSPPDLHLASVDYNEGILGDRHSRS